MRLLAKTVIIIATSLLISFSSSSVIYSDGSKHNNISNKFGDKITVLRENNNEEIDHKIDAVLNILASIKDDIKEKNACANAIPIIVVIIAGLLALLQVKANIISSARIEWTQNLRTTLSLFLSEVININLNLRELASKYNGTNETEIGEEYKKQYENFKKANEYACQIKLSLNNQEEREHRDLQTLIDKYVEKATKDERFDDVEQLDRLQNEIIELSQKILKQAWEDAKTFKLKDIFKFGI